MTRSLRAVAILLLLFPSVACAATPSLSLRASQPSLTGSIPQGAQRIPVLTVTLSASCGRDVTLTSLSLRHTGLGDPTDILRIYALNGIARASRVAAVSSTYPSAIRFSSFVIPACGTQTLTIAVDLARQASAGGEHRFTLVGATATAPVSIVASSATPGRLTVTPHTTAPAVSAEFKPLTGEFNYGAQQLVAQLLLTSASNGDQQITAITFTNDGSAQGSDLQNLQLQTAGGLPLSAPLQAMSNRTARIVLSPPLTLASHETKFVQLRADIRASRSHTIRWMIDQPSDIEVSETSGR